MSGMFTHLLLSGGVGALIGALTNDLAVRWIFRFLIPGKKREMALAVRDIVAEELLAPEKVAEKLRSEQVKQMLHRNLREILDRFLADELPSPEDLLKNHPDILDSLSDRVLQAVATETATTLQHENFFQETLAPFISKEIDGILAKRPGEVLPALTELAETLPERTGSFLQTAACRDRFAAVAAQALNPVLQSERPLRDLFPPSINQDINELFARQAPVVTERIATFLETPETQAVIRRNIRHALDAYFRKVTPGPVKQTGRFFGNLLGIDVGEKLIQASGIDEEVDRICSTIPDRIRHDSGEQGMNRKLEQMVHRIANDFLGMPVCELTGNMKPGRTEQALADTYTHLLTQEMVGQLTDEVRRAINKSMERSVGESLQSMKLPLDKNELVSSIAEKLWDALRTDDFLNLIKIRLTELIGRLRAQKIGTLNSHLSPDARERLAEVAGELVAETVASRFEDFAEQSGMWDVITTSIEDYDNQQIEQVVRRIADQELKWVTIMGGIIGFLIGIAQGLLTLWQKTS